MRVHVFTSAALNYLPRAHALFASIRQVRPDWRLHLALADRAPPGWSAADWTREAGCDEVHELADLGIPAWRTWAFSHVLIELATGIKPFALAKLLARPDCDAAIYLDPDILVYSDLADLVAHLADADVLVTPHQTTPEPTLLGVVANEVCSAQHGIYNLGFLAVAARPQGLAFADWWRARVYRYCREDIPNGLYTDQRWIDFAPSYFDTLRILREPHLNVAPWNLGARRLAGAPGAVTVDGRPLGFLHFSAADTGGFDALPADPVLGALLADYRARIAPGPAGLRPWALATFDDGQPILREQRLVLRLRADLQQAFPDPYAGGFQAWWDGQAAGEFPALFDPATRDAEVARLSSALVTGYPEL